MISKYYHPWFVLGLNASLEPAGLGGQVLPGDISEAVIVLRNSFSGSERTWSDWTTENAGHLQSCRTQWSGKHAEEKAESLVETTDSAVFLKPIQGSLLTQGLGWGQQRWSWYVYREAMYTWRSPWEHQNKNATWWLKTRNKSGLKPVEFWVPCFKLSIKHQGKGKTSRI